MNTFTTQLPEDLIGAVCAYNMALGLMHAPNPSGIQDIPFLELAKFMIAEFEAGYPVYAVAIKAQTADRVERMRITFDNPVPPRKSRPTSPLFSDDAVWVVLESSPFKYDADFKRLLDELDAHGVLAIGDDSSDYTFDICVESDQEQFVRNYATEKGWTVQERRDE